MTISDTHGSPIISVPRYFFSVDAFDTPLHQRIEQQFEPPAEKQGDAALENQAEHIRGRSFPAV